MTKLNKAEENHQKTAQNLTIFIDESGTLPDPRDKFVVICGVGVRQTKEAKNIESIKKARNNERALFFHEVLIKHPILSNFERIDADLKNLISRILSSLKQRKIRIKEIKFYHAGQNTKRQFLSGIVSANFEIFALIVNKKGRKIADSPENFALLVADLVNEINLWYKLKKINLVIDRHFHRKVDQNKFSRFIRQSTNSLSKYQIKHADSQQDPLVNTADMPAGAILWKYADKDPQFYNLIKENIVVEKIVSWPEVKRKNVDLKKKLT